MAVGWYFGIQSCYNLFLGGIGVSESGRKLTHTDTPTVAFSGTRGQELKPKLISGDTQKSPVVSDKERNPKATQKTRMVRQAHRWTGGDEHL